MINKINEFFFCEEDEEVKPFFYGFYALIIFGTAYLILGGFIK